MLLQTINRCPRLQLGQVLKSLLSLAISLSLSLSLSSSTSSSCSHQPLKFLNSVFCTRERFAALPPSLYEPETEEADVPEVSGGKKAT